MAENDLNNVGKKAAANKIELLPPCSQDWGTQEHIEIKIFH